MNRSYSLRVPDGVVSCIRTMHPRIKRKIIAGLDNIIHDPLCGKQLKLELSDLGSYRVGRFRIIYKVTPDKTVALVAVGSRKTIYEKTYRLITG